MIEITAVFHSCNFKNILLNIKKILNLELIHFCFYKLQVKRQDVVSPTGDSNQRKYHLFTYFYKLQSNNIMSDIFKSHSELCDFETWAKICNVNSNFKMDFLQFIM